MLRRLTLSLLPILAGRLMSEPEKSLEELNQEPELPLHLEFILFLKENKKWWLIPIVLVLALMGLLVALSGSAVAPFIYPLF